MASSGSLVNAFQYTARESDTETGLYYYRARYYDPTAGRFVSEDPTEFSGGINFYTYVFNGAPNWIDPSGLDCKTIYFFTICHQEGMFPSEIAAENAHEAQHRKDNLGLLANLGVLGPVLAPRIPAVCEAMESRGFAREIPILEKRINELKSKTCPLTQKEKDELGRLIDQLDNAKGMTPGSINIKDYCHTVLHPK